MAVLIEGMEMPKRGMVVNIYADGRVTNHFDEFGKTIGKAVPVPDPHGRLIDASEKIRVRLHDDEHEDWCTAEMTIDDLLGPGWIDAEAKTVIPASEEGASDGGTMPAV